MEQLLPTFLALGHHHRAGGRTPSWRWKGGLHNYVMESGLITVERRAWRMLDDPRLKAT
ncbi:hypothetical protein Hsc_3683 [Herbaspirillum seropedicae]|nr:hypothetical protein Hsc_3683 [Herbaspirillum seropedicae]